MFAHRGACLDQVENTLPAFEAALALGADVIESDLHVTRDGHAVLAHDADGARLAADPRAIATCSRADIERWNLSHAQPERAPARVPALDDVLAQLPNARLNLDIKAHDRAAVPAVLSVIAGHRAERRVLLTSFSSAITRELRALGYDGPVGLAQTEAIAAVFAPSVILRARPPSFLRPGARLQIPVRSAGIPLARRALIDKLRALALPVDYWVINDVSEAEQLLAIGAQGIVTDDVRAMAALFARSSFTAAWRERHGHA